MTESGKINFVKRRRNSSSNQMVHQYLTFIVNFSVSYLYFVRFHNFLNNKSNNKNRIHCRDPIEGGEGVGAVLLGTH